MWIRTDKENSELINEWTFEEPIIPEPDESDEEPIEPEEPWIEVSYCPYITAEKLESGRCRYIDEKITYLDTEVFFQLTEDNYIYTICYPAFPNAHVTNLTSDELNELFPEGGLTDGKWQIDENGLIVEAETVNELIAQRQIPRLRRQRETECFPIINRGLLWYNSLSPEQLEELSTWYQAWLDVTETLEPPEKPSWLE